jgi:hypothetical protein
MNYYYQSLDDFINKDETKSAEIEYVREHVKEEGIQHYE